MVYSDDSRRTHICVHGSYRINFGTVQVQFLKVYKMLMYIELTVSSFRILQYSIIKHEYASPRK